MNGGRLGLAFSLLTAACGQPGPGPTPAPPDFQVLAELHSRDHAFLNKLGSAWEDEFVFSGYCGREACRFGSAAGDAFEFVPIGLPDSFLGRMTEAGELRWRALVTGLDQNLIQALAVDPRGITAVTGSVGSAFQIVSADGTTSEHSAPGPQNALVAFFDPDGRELSTVVLTASVGAEGRGIEWVADGAVVVGLDFAGSLDLVRTGGEVVTLTARGRPDGLVLRMNTRGEVDWWLHLGGDDHEWIGVLKRFSDGSIKARMSFSQGAILDLMGETILDFSGGDARSLVVSIGPEGRPTWSFLGASVWLSAFLEDEAGGFHAVGGYSYPAWLSGTQNEPVPLPPFGHPHSTDGLLARYDRAGALEWVTCFGGYSQDWANRIDRLPDGLLRVSGFGSLQDFSIPDLATEEIRGSDVYSIDFDESGEPVGFAVLSGPGEDWLTDTVMLAGGAHVLGVSTRSELIEVAGIDGRRRTIPCEGEVDGLLLRRIE